MGTKRWNIEKLRWAVRNSTSMRQVLKKLGLVQASGNYVQVKKHIEKNKLDIRHFRGRAWNKGLRGIGKPILSLEQILVLGSHYQSYKLKKRLFENSLRKPRCEECGWAKMSKDGRIPLELDHINGNRLDNRIENLRILCPNCHSMKPTHRGKNKNKG